MSAAVHFDLYSGGLQNSSRGPVKECSVRAAQHCSDVAADPRSEGGAADYPGEARLARGAFLGPHLLDGAMVFTSAIWIADLPGVVVVFTRVIVYDTWALKSFV